MKYSIEEIDKMRAMLLDILLPINVPYRRVDIDKQVEAQLRTHMMNGTTVEELITHRNRVNSTRFQEAKRER